MIELNIFAVLDDDSIDYFFDENRDAWFKGASICRRLGLKAHVRDIQVHTKEDERQKLNDNLNGVWYIKESGVWRMIFGARTAEAEEIKDNLYRNVLPEIHKRGLEVFKR